MSLRLKHRAREPEWMDQVLLDPASAAAVCQTLEKVNARLGGVRATLYHVERFARQWKPGQRVRFVDWGTGGADIPRALVRWGRDNGFAFEVTAVDTNPALVDYARVSCNDYPEITVLQEDFLAPGTGLWDQGATDGALSPQPTAPFDYALSSLTLHHLDDKEIVTLLRRSHRLTQRGLIMNDLKRSRRAWLWIWALTRLTGAPPIVQNDAPLSVANAFYPDELARLAGQAGIDYAGVYGHFGYRLTLAGEKPLRADMKVNSARELLDVSPI